MAGSLYFSLFFYSAFSVSRDFSISSIIYNAENIIEAEMLVEMLKENGIAAFTQEPSSSVAAYGVAGFGVYGVDIWAEADEAEKAAQK